ncbi:MAG: beta-aspartyl-peptidase [Candidatus Aminicenantes bacterium]|nr:MAG: beta-aspartyl-peptidase [Candidatus Aminicenantes bacterium]
MILFKGCEVYAPGRLGRKDVLLAGGKIAAVEDTIEMSSALCSRLNVEVISADGLRMVPGLIDGHVHIAGAGGEGGPATRTPEMPLSKMLDGGITTVIGCLGTDGMTRSVESVLMKAKGLRAQGVSAWIYTGAYQVPPPTILGDVGKDIAMIDEVIGVGEIAISDHRSSGPTVDQLIHLAEHARVGGMLGGKAGIVNFHMGDAKNPFDILYQVVEKSELRFTQFLPTHCTRNTYIFEDAKIYGKNGYVDLTASSYPYYPQYEIKPSKAVKELVKAGVPLEHITMSSDGCGSLPNFDDKGNLVKLDSGEPKSIFIELIDMVEKEKFPLEQALKVVTSNVADILKLTNKGRIAKGKDADVLLLDNQYRVYHLVANGNLMVKDAQKIKLGYFE